VYQAEIAMVALLPTRIFLKEDKLVTKKIFLSHELDPTYQRSAIRNYFSSIQEQATGYIQT
jgi:hypothetical protein